MVTFIAYTSSDWWLEQPSVTSPVIFYHVNEETSYTFKVKINHPTCPWSKSDSITTSSAACTEPRNLELTYDFEAITATWDEPASNPRKGYYIEYVPTSGTTETYSTSYNYTSHTQYGLTKDIEYTVRVRVNRDGCPWSDSKKATPKNECTEPRNLELTYDFEAITATWDEPASLTGSSGYYIEYVPTSGTTETYSTSYNYTSHTQYGLTNDIEYTVRVRVNRDGCPWSDSKKATPKNECTEPRNLELTYDFEGNNSYLG